MKDWHRIELNSRATYHWLEVKQWCRERNIEFRSQRSTWTFWIQNSTDATLFQLKWG